jgi:CRP-like cAMP-binding protein
MVHGDLKPENLMLSTPNRFDSVVKVIDFGTAQILDEKGIPTLSNAGVGTTPAFCPPEVLQPNREDPKRKPSMDMWALGIILYTMLVGVHPFDLRGDATNELIAYRVVHRKDPPLRGSSFTRHLSDSSIDLIEKLLSWDEETRLTADDMLKHPWICGLTASRSKIEGSDNKLSKLRPIKSRLEAKVFRDFMSWADEGEQGKEASGMSLFERSFRNFDTSSKGFLTAGDVGKELNEKVDDDEALSLSAFSTLLSENMQNHFFKKSEVIFKEGDEGKEMYFLNSGIVEVKTEDGFRTTLKAGDFVGEAALLNEMKRSGTVTCITPVHAIKITKENFAKYLSASDSTLSLQMLETTKSREASRKLFNGFSDLLSESMKNKSFKQGDIIYHEGDKGNNMFFIKSGTVTVNNKEGFRTTLKQGDFVGEGSLLSNKPRSSTVTCLTPVEGMMIQRAYFEKYIVSSGKDLRLKVYRENKSRDLARVRGILRQQKHLRPITFCEGDFLFKEGEVTKNMYIAVDGEFDIKAGDLSVLRIKKGNICGMHSLVFESPRKLSARCATKKCSVVEIGPRTFRGLLESSSSLKDSIVDTCRQREFRRAVVFHTKQTFPKTEKELLEAFKCVQYGHSGKAIMLKDVHRLLRNANPEISDTEVREVFQSIDLGGNGSINFEMFKVLFLE